MKIPNKAELVSNLETAIRKNDPISAIGSMFTLFLNMIEAQTEAMERMAVAFERISKTVDTLSKRF